MNAAYVFRKSQLLFRPEFLSHFLENSDAAGIFEFWRIPLEKAADFVYSHFTFWNYVNYEDIV